MKARRTASAGKPSPAAPEASANTESLVLVSPSIEMRWKLRSMAARRWPSISAGVSAASVIMAPMVVAMFGWIMPAPLAQPTTVQRRPACSTVRDDHLAYVSVVMMARAKGSRLPCAARAAMGAISGSMRSTGSCTPMTPVEFSCTATDEMSHARATASASSMAFAMPRSPVAALAQPELMRRAPQWPRLSLRCRRLSCTGAAHTRLVV